MAESPDSAQVVAGGHSCLGGKGSLRTHKVDIGIFARTVTCNSEGQRIFVGVGSDLKHVGRCSRAGADTDIAGGLIDSQIQAVAIATESYVVSAGAQVASIKPVTELKVANK